MNQPGSTRRAAVQPSRKRGDPIDWATVRERLQQVQEAAEARPSPQQARAILDERARLLARRIETPASSDSPLVLLIFMLGAERYAIETRHVREVVRQLDVTPVPGVADFFVGVTNYRGQILCVVDLERVLGARSAPTRGGPSSVIVIGNDTADIGVPAEQIDVIGSVRRSELLPASQSITGIEHEHLLGVTREALLVVDGTHLLQDSRLFIDQRETGAR